MLKTLLFLTAIVVIAAAAYSWTSATSSDIPADPLTEMTSNALKAKVQSGVTLKTASLRQRMQITMAAPEQPMIDAIIKESAELHVQVAETIRQLIVLGESEEQINHWLGLVQWPAFIIDEKNFTKFANAR